MTDKEKALAQALNALYWHLKAIYRKNPNIREPSTFNGSTDVMGRSRSALYTVAPTWPSDPIFEEKPSPPIDI